MAFFWGGEFCPFIICNSQSHFHNHCMAVHGQKESGVDGAFGGIIINESVLSETSFTQISLLDGLNTRSPSPPLQQVGNDEDANNSVEDLLQTSFSEQHWITGSPVSVQQQEQQPSWQQPAQQKCLPIPFSLPGPSSPQHIEGENTPATPIFQNDLDASFEKMASNLVENKNEEHNSKANNSVQIDSSSMNTLKANPLVTSVEPFTTSMNRRSTTLTLKDQEKTIDTLKKDNFGLKMKIYYLEKRLDELSPDQNDLAIRENIDLKVNIQTLGQELKKYKNMILELNQAMAILQQQSCPKPHGMSKEQQMEYDEALASADACRLENDQLQKLVSEQRMENARLRLLCSQRLGASHNNTSTNTTNGNVIGGLANNPTYPSTSPSVSQHQQQQLISSSLSPSSSSSSTSTPSREREILERYKKSWVQAKQTIQDQNETIMGLQDTIQQQQYNHSRVATSALGSSTNIFTEGRRGNIHWHELEQNLTLTRERNRDLLSQLQRKSKEMERAWADKEELNQILENTRQELHDKCLEYDEVILQLDHTNTDRNNRREEEMEKKKLWQQYDQLERNYQALKMDYSDMEERRYSEQQKCQHLQNLLDQREHDMELLEDEIVKLVTHAETIEKQLQDSNQELEQKEEEYTSRLQDEKNNTIQSYLHYQQQQQEDIISELEKKFSSLMAIELEQKQAHYQQLESSMLKAHTLSQEEAKQRYEDDLQLLEIKFNQVEQSIRERDVRIASLEGHLEAQTDATDREKQIRQEEIKELEEQLQGALNTIQQQQRTIGQYQQQISASNLFDASDEIYSVKQEELEARIQSLQNHLQEADDRLKRDRHAANQALNDYMKSQHLLQQKLEAVRKRNDILTSLLDQCQNPESKINGKRLDKATRLLTKLNQELHHELEERDRHLELERKRAQQLDELYAQSLQELNRAEQQLVRRDNMITRALERIEVSEQKKKSLLTHFFLNVKNRATKKGRKYWKMFYEDKLRKIWT
ncbi:hypothetical protein BC941DRAFT_441584 [Chlamydoabsidia padenii]|nr:hypothetical protein BC941DRAFT_441584 [Chlamydoabsidia padenii]